MESVITEVEKYDETTVVGTREVLVVVVGTNEVLVVVVGTHISVVVVYGIEVVLMLVIVYVETVV